MAEGAGEAETGVGGPRAEDATGFRGPTESTGGGTADGPFANLIECTVHMEEANTVSAPAWCVAARCRGAQCKRVVIPSEAWTRKAGGRVDFYYIYFLAGKHPETAIKKHMKCKIERLVAAGAEEKLLY